ncbi:MAG: FkbM family methyltransferase [Eubacterium sp.]|nr:FkbM family methyltransferase [Eubacterium sp.]
MSPLDITNVPSLWERLQTADKPIILYGMGDGAQKVLNVMNEKNISPAGFMASDDFVRGHSFAGFEVRKYSDIKAQYGEFIVLVCFGTQRPEVLENIHRIAAEQELYVPDVPVIGGGLFDKEYAEEHIEELSEVYGMLADEQSRRLFEGWLYYRISGDIRYLIPHQTEKGAAYPLLELGESETYADLGAFNGDTVEEFLTATGGKVRRVYAFEPDRKSLERLKKRHAALEDKLVTINAGAWDREEELPFVSKGGRNSGFIPFTGGLPPKAASVKMTPMKSLDGVAGDDDVTVIKFDTEGCEDRAIDGCEQIIRRCKPKLIVSLYHRPEDMFALPLKIKALNPEYRMYLREPPYLPAWDVELYCK